MFSTILLPPRAQLCIRYCSNKQQQLTGISVVPARRETKGQPRTLLPMRLDPILPRLESRPCPMYLLGIGVRDANSLIDPRTPQHQQGGVHPFMDGHPHRCSTDFEQRHTTGRHLSRRGVGCPRVPLGTHVTAFGETGVPTPRLEGGVGCNPRVTFDGKVRNLGLRTICLCPRIRFPLT
jgi:hypothetical protein